MRIALLGAVALLSGCSAYMHGYTLNQYTNRTLSPDTEDGAYRLDLESKFDVAIRTYLSDHGMPDYFRVVDGSTVYLYYLDEDLVTEFVRPTFDTDSQVHPHRPIPEEQLSWLPIAAASQVDETSPPSAFDACFARCRELTDRSKEECFDVCRE